MKKARAKTNATRNAGQKTPGGIATRNPRASHDGASPKESLQKHETLRRMPRQGNRRGSRLPILRSQPRVIGLGLLRRARPRQSDYDSNTQLQGRSSMRHSLPCKSTRMQGKTMTSSASLYGRF